MRLKGKTVLITGAGSGIGRGAAELFSKEGASIIVADRNFSSAEKTAKIINESGGKALAVEVDVSKENEVKLMIEKIMAKFEQIDVLVNNAGIQIKKTVTECEEFEWDRVISVNLKGVFLCSKYVIPWMIKQGGGVIVNTASQMGFVGGKKMSAYNASKGGVINLTRGMALDYAKYNIRVNCFCPGCIDTPLAQDDFDSQPDPIAARKEWEALHPLGRFGTIEEAAYALLFLASDESSFMTGASLVVDGGFIAQ